MPFDALELSYRLIETLCDPVQTLQARDRDLARQIRLAASSISLNLAEGRERIGGDRLQLFRTAHGSATEVRAALRVASAWGYVSGPSVAPSGATLDRLCAICWRLTRG